MFYTYDSQAFGTEIKKLRHEIGLTQINVSRQTGINTNTLRLIENGKVIPKYETLALLSNIYKYDILELFHSSFSDIKLRKLYSDLNMILSNHASEKSISNCYRILEELNENQITNHLLYPNEVEQLIVLVKSIIQFDDKSRDLSEIKYSLVEGIKLTTPSFDFNEFNKKALSIIESHCLYIISLIMSKEASYKQSNDILFYLASKNNYDNQHILNMKLKFFYHIAYNFHFLDDFQNALKYAEKGIQMSLENNNCYLLSSFYARKAIALYYLNDYSYEDFMEKTLILLELLGKKEEISIYKNIFTKQYNFKTSRY